MAMPKSSHNRRKFSNTVNSKNRRQVYCGVWSAWKNIQCNWSWSSSSKSHSFNAMISKVWNFYRTSLKTRGGADFISQYCNVSSLNIILCPYAEACAGAVSQFTWQFLLMRSENTLKFNINTLYANIFPKDNFTPGKSRRNKRFLVSRGTSMQPSLHACVEDDLTTIWR